MDKNDNTHAEKNFLMGRGREKLFFDKNESTKGKVRVASKLFFLKLLSFF